MAQRLPIEVIDKLLRVCRQVATDNHLQDLSDAIDDVMHDEISHLMNEIDGMSEAEYSRAWYAASFDSRKVEVSL